MILVCEWCMKKHANSSSRGPTARYCSSRCRQAASRHRRIIPQELTLQPRWVEWTKVRTRIVAIDADGAKIDARDPAHWLPIEDVPPARRGFVLDDDGIICISAPGSARRRKLTPWAKGLIDAVGASWTLVDHESGGMQIWGLADPGRRVKYAYAGHRIEVLARKRYIPLVGQPLPGCPTYLADMSKKIKRL